MNAGTPALAVPRFTYLRDVPATDDAFGSHKRIADAVANAIVDNKGLRVVGIVGPWGSGKSTVVGFIENAVKAQTNTHVFTYDAWLHQSDPPRRAFLEELIHFLIRKELTAANIWKDELDRLAGRLEDTTTTRTPVLTLSGRLVLVSLLFSPIGFGLVMKSSIIQALASDTAAAGLASAAHAPPGFWLGLALMSLPVIAATVVYLCWRPTWKVWKPEFWFTHRGKHAKESIFSLVMNRKVETERSRVIRDPTPTAIEFQRAFRKILGRVADARHEFLFVVDNLDRLPAAEALEMWSIIQSFFLGAPTDVTTPQPKHLPTIILPVDEDAITRIYGKGEVNEEARTLAQAFMDKTFDLTFRITRPVYTGWRAFLECQMKSVFGGNVNLGWIARSGEFLDYRALETASPITPRRINNLVNELAITWTQWHAFNISFVSICYYCVFRTELDNDIAGSARRIGMPKASIDLHDPAWQRAVAAMHFGVDPEIAFQVLLTGPLRQAIEQAKPEVFRKLMEQQGFAEVLRKVAEGYRVGPETTPKVVVQAINLLDTEEPEGATAFAEIWRLLDDALPKTARWDAFDSDDLDAIHALLKRGSATGNGQLLESIQKCINSSVKEKTEETAETVGKLWDLVACNFETALPYVSEIRLPGGSDTLVHVASICRNHLGILEKLQSVATDNSAVTTLGVDLSGRPDEDEDERLRGVFNAHKISESSSYLQSCVSVVNNAIGQTTKTALLAFCLLGKRPEWRAQMPTLVSRLVALIPPAIATKNFRVVARASALLIAEQPASFPGIAAKLTTDEMTSLVAAYEEAVVDYLGARMGFEAALDVIDANQNTQVFLGSVLTHRLAGGDLSSPSVALLFSHFDVIEKSIATDALNDLLNYLVTFDAFWGALASQSLSKTWLAIYDRVAVTHPEDARLTSLLDEKLNQGSDADWTSAIEGTSLYLDALNLLDEDAPGVEVQAISGPLTSKIDQAITSSDRAWISRWFLLAKLLPSYLRQTLFRNVRDRVVHNYQLDHLPALLNAGGAMLLDDGHFDEKADDFMRRIIMPGFAETTEGRDYLGRFAARLEPILQTSEGSTRASVKDWVQMLMRDQDGSKQEIAGKLAGAWGLDLSPVD